LNWGYASREAAVDLPSNTEAHWHPSRSYRHPLIFSKNSAAVWRRTPPVTARSRHTDRTKKPAAGFPWRGLWNSCDDEDMPVICPTCQIPLVRVRPAPPGLVLFKPLNRWRHGSPGGKRRRPDSRRRTCRCGCLSLRRAGGLCCMCCTGSRRRSLHPPGARDRRPRGISDERTCHRADRSEHDGARHRAQRCASGTLLGFCLEREKRSCDQCTHKQSLHRGSVLEPSAGQGTAGIRRHKGDGTADSGTSRHKKARRRFPGAGSNISMLDICR
jgi:hypothetical protein